jgi:glycosyltransferase involved in cell wall biosynthesis
MATSDFYKNLIRFGRFDEYHFFILGEKGNAKKILNNRELMPYIHDKRVKIRKVSQLPLFLKDAQDFVFFIANPGMFDISRLRSIYAKKYFPICGLTYTISYGYLLERVFFKNMISDLQPFDSIVSIAKPVLESLKRMHRLIRQDVFNTMSAKISYRARLDQLPLGLNSEHYLKGDKNKSRRELGLPAGKVIILYFGRFSASDKADIFPLLFAFKNLLSKNKNIFLVLAGKNFQGNYAARLKQAGNDLGILHNIKFFLNPSQEEKYSLYAASDIFVSPSDSLQESFGLTVIEAMAAGLPAVVSDWDGYRDIVIHNKTGFRVPTYWIKCDRRVSEASYLYQDNIQLEHLSLGQSVCVDVNKMIEYLSLLIKRKDLRLKFGHSAREKVHKYYDWSVVIPRYEALWNTLMDKARACRMTPKKMPIFYPRYFECFSHYPSRILNKQTNIAITEEGERLLKTRRFLSTVPPLGLILPQIVFLLLFYLREKKKSSIGKINEYMNKPSKEISSEEISYHLMWMLKNYYVKTG